MGGIRSKIDIIRHYTSSLNPMLFFISEANIKNVDDKNLIKIPEYYLVHTDFWEGTSRLACYVKCNMGFEVRELGKDGTEFICVENKTTRFIGVYRQFTYHNELTLSHNFERLLSGVSANIDDTKTTLVGGDFNLDFKKLNDTSYANRSMLIRLDLWSIEMGLTQQIHINTRRRLVNLANGSQRLESSCIDHVYGPTRSDLKYQVQHIPGSDHDAVEVSWPELRQITEKQTARSWQHYNEENIAHLMNSGIPSLYLRRPNEYHDPDVLANDIANVHRHVMEKLCPLRVFTLRRNNQIVDGYLEKIKKRRDRYLKKFHKDNSVHMLSKANLESKRLKRIIKESCKRKIQMKATSPNPKTFWSAIKEVRGKFRDVERIELLENGKKNQDPKKIADLFADFFVEKVDKLAAQVATPPPTSYKPNGLAKFIITGQMLENAVRSLKNKKSYGIDGISLCVVRDTYQWLSPHYLKLMNLCTDRIPECWKTARVLPLHKKGDKAMKENYRPISNMCSMDKLFEKIILHEMDRRYPDLEGCHQHGFRAQHSTVTAMHEIQSGLTDALDKNQLVLLYSTDLSAAFDVLNKNIFYQTLRGDIADDLMSVIMDFLSERRLVVEIEGMQSSPRNIQLGCVQGSILGPKIFSLYMKDLPKHVDNNLVTSYADDTYVMVTGSSHQEVIQNAERCLAEHMRYLKNQGMVTNFSKTEAVYFHKTSHRLEIKLGNESFNTTPTMKVLGVIFDHQLSWTEQVNAVVDKGRRMNNALKFIRGRLTHDQFIKVLTSQFLGVCFYGCNVWLNGQNGYHDVRKLNALHYRSLRIAAKDYRRKLKRSQLDEIGRSRPTTWAKYSAANLVIKTFIRKSPKRLYDDLVSTCYRERRRPRRPKFFNKSDHRIGRQTLCNRAGELLNEASFDWDCDISDNLIRRNLKKHFNMTHYIL